VISSCRAVARGGRSLPRDHPHGLALLEKFEGWREGRPTARRCCPATSPSTSRDLRLPLDLTEVIGRERGFVIDEVGYAAARAKHSAVSKGDGEGSPVSKEERVRVEHRDVLAKVGGGGLQRLRREVDEARVEALFALGDDGSLSPSTRSRGRPGQVVTSRTPFYGESGGQVGDVGVINAGDSHLHGDRHAEARARPGGARRNGHRGLPRVGEQVTLSVDREARRRRGATTARRTCSTGRCARCSGRTRSRRARRSPRGAALRLRLDPRAHRRRGGPHRDLVNDEVLANLPVRTEVTTQAEARRAGP
jgi:hypothetical protein